MESKCQKSDIGRRAQRLRKWTIDNSRRLAAKSLLLAHNSDSDNRSNSAQKKTGTSRCPVKISTRPYHVCAFSLTKGEPSKSTTYGLPIFAPLSALLLGNTMNHCESLSHQATRGLIVAENQSEEKRSGLREGRKQTERERERETDRQRGGRRADRADG